MLLVWLQEVSDPNKIQFVLLSSTSGETQPYYIFVPKSLLTGLAAKSLFQTREEEKLICKAKEKVLLGQAKASFGDRPYPPWRVNPNCKGSVGRPGRSRGAGQAAWSVGGQLAVGSQICLFSLLTVGFFVCKGVMVLGETTVKLDNKQD